MPRNPRPTGDVHTVALAMLARRAYSRGELEQRLTRKGYAPGEVAAELERLERVGLLDDAQLAHAVRRQELRRGLGRRGVAAALRRRHVGEEHAAVAIAAVSPEKEQEALAVALEHAVRRHAASGGLPGARRKVIRYLLARGFATSDVLCAVAARLGEISDEEAVELTDAPDLP